MQTRRQFVVRAGTVAASAILSPSALAAGLGSARPAALARGGRFSEGVMSGEPTPSAITLWTRLADAEGKVSLDLEVATDKNFRHVVAHKRLPTSAAVNHNVKSRITGLKAHEQYYYRFATATKDGPVGRFRTALPADSLQPVRFAFWSCQDYTHGYYNAHEAMAREDLDFVVCLGDYIYDETYHTVKDGTGVRDDKIGRDGTATGQAGVDYFRAAETLSDYRDKYSLYRSDESLRKVQARFPTVMLWDDHEVQDNYAGGAPDGGLPPSHHYSKKRQAAAYKAFFETMPYSPPAGERNRIYRRLQFGRTVDLLIMDQRQYRADQPCDDATGAPACADYDQPRTFLGTRQMNWLKTQLNSSKAAWKVLANEVTIMPTPRPRRRVLRLRQLGRVPPGAREPSDPHPRWPDQGRRLRHRRHPHLHRRRRAHRRGHRRPRRDRVRRRLGYLLGARARPTCRPAAGWSSRATTRTRTRTRRSSTR